MGGLTRWGSNLNQYDNQQLHRLAMINVVCDPDAADHVTEELYDIVMSREYWNNLQSLQDTIRTLKNAVTSTEADWSIGNVYRTWTLLEEFYHPENGNRLVSDQMRIYITDKLNKRWDLISHDIHSAGFILNPKFVDLPLEDVQYADGERFIKGKAGDKWNVVQTQLIRFRSREGVFNYPELYNAPLRYWQRLMSIKSVRDLAVIALEIIGFPQTCASVERSFSVVRRIHTWQRNRLDREKLAKLVYIYFNERALKKEGINVL